MGTVRAVVELRVIEVRFDDRRQLAAALLPDLEPAGLFVAGELDLAAGERVEVLVRVDGIEPGMCMAATVAWRRVGRGGRAPAGLALCFARAESARFEWLRAFAGSNLEARPRAAPRLPVSIPVAFVVSQGTEVHSGTLVDLSEGGALLHAVPAPLVDELVVLRLRNGRSGPPVPARVVWTADTSSGLRMVADRSDICRFWERVVRAARADLDARIVQPPGERR